MTDSSDQLAFSPVFLIRARHDGWTIARQHKFIACLATIGLVSAAARSVGMSAKSAYALRKRAGAESFAAAWDRALSLGQQVADAEAVERAVHGVKQPIFYKGKQVGVKTVYNDRLLIAALRRFGRFKFPKVHDLHELHG